MTTTRDWRRNRDMWIGVLEKQTGEGVTVWNRRICRQTFGRCTTLRRWLSEQGVTGYAWQLLIMERFGYPDFVLATADELVRKEYADRPHLRAIYDAIIEASEACGAVVIQARKTYVSLVAPRRTFARVQAATKTRIDLSLRLDGQPAGRLRPSKIHETMRLRVGLTAPDQIDAEVRNWLRLAYADNA